MRPSILTFVLVAVVSIGLSLLNVALGVIGAFVGGFMFTQIGGQGITGFNVYSMFVAVIGAIVVLLIYHALTGRRRLIVKVPILTPKLSSLWLGLVTDLPTSVGRPLVDGLSVEVIAGDDRIRSLVPFTLLGYDDAVRLAISVGLEQLEAHGDE